MLSKNLFITALLPLKNYRSIDYKYTPFTRKKSVVPPAEIIKNIVLEIR